MLLLLLLLLLLLQSGWARHVGEEDWLLFQWRRGVFGHRAIPAEAEEGVSVGKLLKISHPAGFDEGLRWHGAVLGYFADGHGIEVQTDEVALGRVVLERDAVVGVVEEGDGLRFVGTPNVFSEPSVVLPRKLEIVCELEI